MSVMLSNTTFLETIVIYSWDTTRPFSSLTIPQAFPLFIGERGWCIVLHPLDSRLSSRLRRPVGRFNTELPGVLRVEPLPAELHRLATNDAANGSYAEQVIQDIETNVPAGSTP